MQSTEHQRTNIRRRARVVSLLLAAACVAIGFAPAALAQTPLEDCLNSDGMAFVGGHSAAVTYSSNVTWLFGGPGGGTVLCDPSLGGEAVNAAVGNAATVAFAGGTGGITTTGAIAAPDSSSMANGYFAGSYYYKFRVIPDDPTSIEPITIDFITRHEFGTVLGTASGSGAFFQNSFQAKYWVNQLPIQTLFPRWTSGSGAPTAGTYVDIPYSMTVFPNQDLYFIAEIRQSSLGTGRISPEQASASASVASVWTFEATTDDPATIVWEIETALGLAPPQLDVVPEPAFAASLATCLLGLSMASRRRDRRPGSRCASGGA